MGFLEERMWAFLIETHLPCRPRFLCAHNRAGPHRGMSIAYWAAHTRRGHVHRLQVQPGEQPLPLHPGGLPVLLPPQAPDDLPRPEAHAEDAGEELRPRAPLPGESLEPPTVQGPCHPCFWAEGHAAQVTARTLGPTFSGTPASFQGPPSLMDAETDEGMDYTGCSPGAASSESSTMDRSCSSTPVGNESTAAGERGPGPAPQASSATSVLLGQRPGRYSVRQASCSVGRGSLSRLPPSCPPAHTPPSTAVSGEEPWPPPAGLAPLPRPSHGRPTWHTRLCTRPLPRHPASASLPSVSRLSLLICPHIFISYLLLPLGFSFWFFLFVFSLFWSFLFCFCFSPPLQAARLLLLLLFLLLLPLVTRLPTGLHSPPWLRPSRRLCSGRPSPPSHASSLRPVSHTLCSVPPWEPAGAWPTPSAARPASRPSLPLQLQ